MSCCRLGSPGPLQLARALIGGRTNLVGVAHADVVAEHGVPPRAPCCGRAVLYAAHTQHEQWHHTHRPEATAVSDIAHARTAHSGFVARTAVSPCPHPLLRHASPRHAGSVASRLAHPERRHCPVRAPCGRYAASRPRPTHRLKVRHWRAGTGRRRQNAPGAVAAHAACCRRGPAQPRATYTRTTSAQPARCHPDLCTQARRVTGWRPSLSPHINNAGKNAFLHPAPAPGLQPAPTARRITPASAAWQAPAGPRCPPGAQQARCPRRRPLARSACGRPTATPPPAAAGGARTTHAAARHGTGTGTRRGTAQHGIRVQQDSAPFHRSHERCHPPSGHRAHCGALFLHCDRPTYCAFQSVSRGLRGDAV